MQPRRIILDTLLQGSTVDLFHSFGVAVAPVDRSRARDAALFYDLTAIVSFMAKGFSGALTVRVATSVFDAVTQDPARRFSGRDWVRELANQLLGRLKNRLTQFGLVLQTGLPALATQETVELQRQRSATYREYRFRTLRGEVVVTLGGDIDFSIFAYTGGADGANEGDIILF